MNKLILISLLLITFQLAFAQDAKKEVFSEIMNVEFAQDYKDQTIETMACFFESGHGGYRIPNKLKRGYTVFRCYDVKGEPKKNPFGAELGDFVFIKKDKKDLIRSLKKGDKIRLIGEVYVNNNAGYKQANFIATDIKAL